MLPEGGYYTSKICVVRNMRKKVRILSFGELLVSFKTFVKLFKSCFKSTVSITVFSFTNMGLKTTLFRKSFFFSNA